MERAQALRELATALAQSHQWKRAEELSRSIPDDVQRAQALRELATALAQAGRWQEAERIIFSIPNLRPRVQALGELATALAQAGRWQEAERIWQQAESTALSIPDEWQQAQALRELATALAQAGRWQEAERIIQQIRDDILTIIRIRILEDPLTAQNLMIIISALTELHTKCWLIQQNRFADLMDYAQTRDIRFSKEANLRIAQMTYNSPALIDFVVSSASIAGTATLALALKTAIDAVVQAPLRFRATQLQNQKEVLEQKIHEQEAQKALQTTDQKVQIELERQTMLLELTKKQIEVEKQQLELDKQRLEMEKDRVKVVLEITKTIVGQLRSDANEETREMLMHSLVPSLLQLATADGLECGIPQLVSLVPSLVSLVDKFSDIDASIISPLNGLLDAILFGAIFLISTKYSVTVCSPAFYVDLNRGYNYSG